MMRIILVVDDSNSARDIQNRLQRASYDVTTLTATADEVITRADELRPDVILMDVRLKGETDGVKVARQIKSLHDIPIIFITANADEATVRRAIAAEPDGFLIMPLDALELRAAIEIAIHRHGTEAKAGESDRHISELTESLSEVIFETDMTGTITFVNQVGLKEFGYTKEQVEGGMTLYDFVPPDKREEIRESIAQAVIDEPSAWIAVPGLRRDGSTFPISVRASLIVREGVPVGIRGIALNVTEQKRAEQKLEESERQLRELTDALPEIVFETDVDSTFTFLNPMGLGSLGYTEADLKKQLKIEDLIIPADLARARENFRKRLGGTAAVWAEYTVQRKGGGTFPLSIRTTAVIRDGVVVGARGIAVDITERKRAEAALIKSERHIREITDTLPVVVYEADETSRVTFVNATAFDLFGYTKEELEAGMSILQVVIDADEERARTMFSLRMGEDDVGRLEYTGRRKDGSTFPISVRGAPIRLDGAVVGVRGIIVDITELKQAEERVEEHTRTIEILNLVMTEGNRAASVQSFAGTVTDLTLELLHFDAGTIHIVEDDARRAKLRYVTGLPDTAVEAIREIPLNEPPYAAFLVEPSPLFLDDHEVSRVPQVAELGLKSFAVVPLYRYDEIIGAFNVGSFKRHTFSQAEKELLIAIGNEVGVVIAKLQTDELIRAALKERETLLKEIHHRVKNNMQVVSSLLSLHAAQATEPETIEILNESQRQIRSMALIHEKLYSSGSLAEIDFGDYVKSLVDDLLRMYNVPLGTVTITTDIENVQLGVDTAIHCALIINELVSNSLKYAFPDGRTGDVTVALQRANGVHTLTVADDGVGFPADLDFRATDSLGMQLVTALINQLDGTITLDRTKGTTFIITFKPEGARAPSTRHS